MKTCLIIEDNPVIRAIIVEILNELGVTPVERETAAEGVDYCAQTKPDIVMLDWDLPAMGALDFLRGIGSFDLARRPAIILCATENDSTQFELAKAAGAEHHLLKPFDKPLLAAKLIAVGVIADPVMARTEVEASQPPAAKAISS